MKIPMMPESSRDCSRTASSRRQLWTAFTRSSRSSGEGTDLVLGSDTARKVAWKMPARNLVVTHFEVWSSAFRRFQGRLNAELRTKRTAARNFSLTYIPAQCIRPVSYTHLRAHETGRNL